MPKKQEHKESLRSFVVDFIWDHLTNVSLFYTSKTELAKEQEAKLLAMYKQAREEAKPLPITIYRDIYRDEVRKRWNEPWNPLQPFWQFVPNGISLSSSSVRASLSP